jgi:hypothetical protein
MYNIDFENSGLTQKRLYVAAIYELIAGKIDMKKVAVGSYKNS